MQIDLLLAFSFEYLCLCVHSCLNNRWVDRSNSDKPKFLGILFYKYPFVFTFFYTFTLKTLPMQIACWYCVSTLRPG